jgi:6-phosphogluconolactonase (cycloisomerase 2 family)
MRMKLNKSSQLLLVAVASLLVASLITACGTLTVDFVFVASSRAAGANNYGEIDVFEINSESGAMPQIPSSPFPSAGRNPVAEAVSSDSANLYVVNQDDNTIVQFLIGSDGKLYPQNTVNTPGVYPLAVAVSGTNLFVLDTYQPLANCSNANPCSGSVAVFPLLPATTGSNPVPSGQPGTPLTNGSLNYWPLNLTGSAAADVVLPTGVNVLGSGNQLYISAYDQTAQTGYVFGFNVASSGALTAIPGSPWAAGSYPSAVASDSSSSYLYVTDKMNTSVLGYSVVKNSQKLATLPPDGTLVALTSGLGGSNRFQAGNQPVAIVAGMATSSTYLYVANQLDSSVSAYTIGANGALSTLGTFATGLQPVALGIDPRMTQFLFTANFLGNNVSGFEISPGSSSTKPGQLINSQNSPFISNAQPTAVAAVSHNGSTK